MESQANDVRPEVLCQHRQFLEERIDVDFGLLDKLITNTILSNKEVRDVKSQLTFDARNSRLLDHILGKGGYDGFVKALCDTKQKHIVNFLRTNGDYKGEFGGVWPLTERETSLLDANQENLVDLIDSSELLSLLYSTGVLNKRQREFISSKATSYEQNETLLDILRRGSLESYWQTIHCLHASNQSHVADVLTKKGILARVDVNIVKDGVDVEKAEEEIVAGITSLLRDRTLLESSRIWELVQLNMIGARRSHSVSLYFHLLQVEQLNRLHDMVETGLMEEIMERLFHHLVATSVNIKVKLRLKYNTYARSQKSIQAINENLTEIIKEEQSFISKAKMSNLPLELLDIILQKSYLLSALSRRIFCHHVDVNIISHLASVETCWLRRIRKQRFKKNITRLLTNFYERTKRRAIICRSNHSFLEENIRLEALVQSLKAKDCLTDLQTALINRNKLNKAKNVSSWRQANSDIMGAIRFFDEEKHSTFCRCLRTCGQRPITRVLVNGGVAVKLEFSNIYNSRIRPSLVKEVIKQQDKNKRISPAIEKIMRELRANDIEVLTCSVHNGNCIAWIWCQSHAALEQLRTFGDFRHGLGVSLGKRLYSLNIECDQFSRELG